MGVWGQIGIVGMVREKVRNGKAESVYIAERNGRTSNEADVDGDWTTRTEARGDLRIRWHPESVMKSQWL